MGLAVAQFKNNNANFDVTFAVTDGYVTITADETEITVTIKGNTVNATYDGTEKKAEGYKVEIEGSDIYTTDDITFTGSALVKGTDAKTMFVKLFFILYLLK